MVTKEDSQWSAGYQSYINGKKVPASADTSYIRGWWAAADAREKFGEYESFLQAPDIKFRADALGT